MTLLGIHFVDGHDDVQVYAEEIFKNSEKQVAKMLFTVKVYTPDVDVLIISKKFVAYDLMNIIFSFMLILSSLPIVLFHVVIPALIVYSLYFVWSIFNTPVFNYWLFKLMIRRMGFKGKLKQL